MEFIKESHLLAILIVSDEEDCSIEDKALFYTPEWKSGTIYDPEDPTRGLLNTACNLPPENEELLFDTTRYRHAFLEMKGGRDAAVVFAAIVGVPTGDDSPCQGSGKSIRDNNCLDDPRMELSVEMFETGRSRYLHFNLACKREEDGTIVEDARPGRRYVRVAQSFDSNGYVYSYCNKDWSPAMKEIARMIARRVGG